MGITRPGRLVAVWGDETIKVGRVLVGDRVDEVNLSLVPEARPGDYITLQSGVAVAVMDEAEAERVLELESGES